jgi:hypothetical protein
VDEGALLLTGATIALFAAGFGAGLYASWFGVLVPTAITVALGYGWEWEPEGILLLVPAGAVSALGWLAGMWRRRVVRRASGA